MKTARDIVTLAFQRASILGLGETLAAEDYEYGKAVLEGQVAEAAKTLDTDKMDGWLPDAIPEEARMGLSGMVAAEIASVAGGTVPEPRSRALGRLKAFLFPDDRDEEDTAAVDPASSYY